MFTYWFLIAPVIALVIHFVCLMIVSYTDTGTPGIVLTYFLTVVLMFIIWLGISFASLLFNGG